MPRPTALVAPVSLALALLVGRAHAAAWPGWRGPTTDMVAADTQVFEPGVDYGLTVRWRAPLGSGYSSVSVAHGLAVTMFSDGESDVLAAFDAATGDEAWRYAVDATYVGHDGSQTGPISTPYITADHVYALGPHGRLVAVTTDEGLEVWSRHLVDDYGAQAPEYGFGTSPLVVSNLLVLQVGAGEGRAIGFFDRHTGDLLWEKGDGGVDYQSPALMKVDGESHVVYSTKEYVGSIRPSMREEVWRVAHGGDGSATGSGAMNPLLIGSDRLFLTHKGSGSMLTTLYGEAGVVTPETLWETRAIRSSYGVPVYHDGYLYSYSRTLLTCVDIETGDAVWKSRPPGDGFPIVVDGHLVTATQKGGLHLAEASPHGYTERAGLGLFDDLVWSPPTFANGSIYARSFGEIARVDVAPTAGPAVVASANEALRGFAAFLARVSVAEDKHAEIDAFLAAQGDLPIIEDGGEDSANVWFVYRGAAEQDVAITGDFLGNRRAETMDRVAGTDLYYYVAQIEPGARLNYRFVVDFDTTVLDPLNPRSVPRTMSIYDDGGGEASWFAMPGWRVADHLSPVEAGGAGRIEQVQIPTGEGPSRTVDVYLPGGYDAAGSAYPVAYVHWGEDTRVEGMVATSLDNLIGHSVKPLIVVFVRRTAGGFGELIWDGRGEYVRSVAEDVVPAIEGRYRVRTGRDDRASVGCGFGGLAALDLAFTYPDLFGKVAAQSPMRLTAQEDELKARVTDAQRHPFRLWLGWGAYDTRSTLEGWSTVTWNVALRGFFETRGYDVAGGQVNQGGGWESWRQRNDEVFETLFPAASAASDDR